MKYADDKDFIEMDETSYRKWIENKRIPAVLATVHAYPDKAASECIELFYLHGIPLKDIAKVMGKYPEFEGLSRDQAVAKVRYKISVALKRIKEEVKDEDNP